VYLQDFFVDPDSYSVMNFQSHSTRVTIAEADVQPLPPDRLSKQVLNTPDLEARWYRRPNPDPQTPHDRDQVDKLSELVDQSLLVRQYKPSNLLSGHGRRTEPRTTRGFLPWAPDQAVGLLALIDIDTIAYRTPV